MNGQLIGIDITCDASVEQMHTTCLLRMKNPFTVRVNTVNSEHHIVIKSLIRVTIQPKLGCIELAWWRKHLNPFHRKVEL